MQHRQTSISLAAVTALCALLAACGGGGGGGGGTPPGGGGGGGIPPTNPTATPSPTAAPTATPGAAGQLVLNGSALANAKAVYTCGCSAQAGSVMTDGSGNVSIVGSTNAIPANPTPTYTAVPGRNYLLIGYAPSSHAQVWTMEFLGNNTPTNLNLAGNNNGLSSDAAASAAALFVYYDAGQKFSASTDQSFDRYNFNAIISYAQSLRTSGGNNAAEKTLISDIGKAQASGASMYPGSGVPVWNPDPSATVNLTITNDLKAVETSGDTAIPTPCPSTGCTGAPSP